MRAHAQAILICAQEISILIKTFNIQLCLDLANKEAKQPRLNTSDCERIRTVNVHHGSHENLDESGQACEDARSSSLPSLGSIILTV